MSEQSHLIYVHDPMCSWCWGFAPVWVETRRFIEQHYDSSLLDIKLVVGGLAPDSDQAMPESLAKTIDGHWHTITEKLGTRFNHDFWINNTPRRSTYPACRAVITAREMGGSVKERKMIRAIQEAYYLNAENPSDLDTLIGCANKIGLDKTGFELFIQSDQCELILQSELQFARRIGGNSFPSLFLMKGDKTIDVPFDYLNANITLNFLEQTVSG